MCHGARATRRSRKHCSCCDRRSGPFQRTSNTSTPDRTLWSKSPGATSTASERWRRYVRMPRRIGMGLVGPGFAGAHHIEAVRRLGFVDVVAVAGSSERSARQKADMLGIPRAYGSYEELIADRGVQVVHNTTPN